MTNHPSVRIAPHSVKRVETSKWLPELRLPQYLAMEMWREEWLGKNIADGSSRKGRSLIISLSTSGRAANHGSRASEKNSIEQVAYDKKAASYLDAHPPSRVSNFWLAMELFLILAALAAFFQTTVNAQYGRRKFPGQPPYRPFPPYRPWPHRPPAPPPPTNKVPVYPKLKTTPQILGLANDPALDRDSCGSMTFIDRTFWTCRDTQLFYPNGSVMISPLITSTASWSDFSRYGGPKLEPVPAGADTLHTTVLRQYGKNSITQAFYPILPDYCDPPSGACSDGTRYALCKLDC